MAERVAAAIEEGRHLVVQAGTGTGKSLAYLLAAVRSGRKVVVATATKALQDQLAQKDLPFIAGHLGAAREPHDRRADAPPTSSLGDFTFAVLKGRSNYLCRQRAAEVAGTSSQRQIFDGAPGYEDEGGEVDLGGRDAEPSDAGSEPADLRPEPDGLAIELNGPGPLPPGRPDEPASTRAGAFAPSPDPQPAGLGRFGSQIRRILRWAEDSESGDAAELDFEPDARAWAALSVSARECPGAYRCPSGPVCFAERARAIAAASDIVVVNTHLYATHVASGGAVLPDHDVLVLDEAHAVEDVMSAGLGVEFSAGRLRAVALSARGLLGRDDAGLVDAVSDAAGQLENVLQALVGRRVTPSGGGGDPSGGELERVLALARGRVEGVAARLRRAGDNGGGGGDEGHQDEERRVRALLGAGHLLEDLHQIETSGEDHVAWVESSGPGGRFATLRLAPVEVGPLLAARLWPEVTGILTSATVPPLIEATLGLPEECTDRVDVGSPFPYQHCALLYCPTDLPDRRNPGSEEAVQLELHRLIEAAGGRTLALFTSWRAMKAAVEVLRPQLHYTLLAQNDLPKAKLLEAFRSEESACLFATMSFWQGVDVPGATLSVVAIDRLPFGRPDDPLLQARRERAGEGAFRLVDLPRAAMLLAQGTGRLIRSSSDSGVVAVLDRRLATAGYGGVLRAALPPMRFTTRREEAMAFLASIHASRA